MNPTRTWIPPLDLTAPSVDQPVARFGNFSAIVCHARRRESSPLNGDVHQAESTPPRNFDTVAGNWQRLPLLATPVEA
jgi:hypothetical protein